MVARRIEDRVSYGTFERFHEMLLKCNTDLARGYHYQHIAYAAQDSLQIFKENTKPRRIKFLKT